MSVDTDAMTAARLRAEHRLPALAAVVDERHADRLCHALQGRAVRDCLSRTVPAPPLADPDATALDVVRWWRSRKRTGAEPGCWE